MYIIHTWLKIYNKQLGKIKVLPMFSRNIPLHHHRKPFFIQVVSVFQAPFGQVQDIAFLPGGEEFISAAEVLRRNSTDKGIMVWDFRSTAIMSNQVYQVQC